VNQKQFYFIGLSKELKYLFIFKKNLYMGKLILNEKYD